MIEDKLKELGITLPEAAAPVASYVPTVGVNGLLYISGQLPFLDGKLITGKVGSDRSEDEAQAAAHACGLMLLAQMQKALGTLALVERVVKLGVFVASTPDFTAQPKVANGASDLMLAVFGETGRHARSAVSVPVLPLNATVEIDAIIQVKA